MADLGLGPLGAAPTALAGIKRASALQDQAAADVQRAFHPEVKAAASPAASVEVSSEARDLANAFTDMMTAKSLNAANVKVLQTADEMTKDLTQLKK